MRVLAVLALTGFSALAGMSAFAGEKLAHLGDPAQAVPAMSSHAKGAADSGRSPMLSDWEKQQISEMVQKQLGAVATGDADEAYAYLDPESQSFYAHPEAFLFAIGQQTRPITEVRDFLMAGIEQDPFRAFQHVFVTDNNGNEWLARFQVVRAPNNAGWRVKRCFIEPVNGERA